MTCSIISSRLDYCNSLLFGISEQNPDCIQRVQSKAARMVCNAGRHSPSSDLLHSLHWLPVRHRIEFKTATLCFKAVKLDTPSYLNNTLKPYVPLRALRSSDMCTCTCWHFTWSSSLFCSWTTSLNRLPHELRQCNTVSCFKSKLKTYYFSTSAATWTLLRLRLRFRTKVACGEEFYNW